MTRTSKTKARGSSPEQIAGYRGQEAITAATRLEAIERHYEERRARCTDPNTWIVCDQALFREALALAATPASSKQEALKKIAFLVGCVWMDATGSGERHVAAMLEAAVDEERRRWDLSSRSRARAPG